MTCSETNDLVLPSQRPTIQQYRLLFPLSRARDFDSKLPRAQLQTKESRVLDRITCLPQVSSKIENPIAFVTLEIRQPEKGKG